MDKLAANRVKYGMVWVDIEANGSPGCGWSISAAQNATGGLRGAQAAEEDTLAVSSPAGNCAYIGQVISALRARGANVGTYVSSGPWTVYVKRERQVACISIDSGVCLLVPLGHCFAASRGFWCYSRSPLPLSRPHADLQLPVERCRRQLLHRRLLHPCLVSSAPTHCVASLACVGQTLEHPTSVLRVVAIRCVCRYAHYDSSPVSADASGFASAGCSKNEPSRTFHSAELIRRSLLVFVFALIHVSTLELQSFSDWRSFGGWTKPAIKQFADGPAVRMRWLQADGRQILEAIEVSQCCMDVSTCSVFL